MRNHGLYLKDILDAMESIEEFVEGMSFEQFTKDDRKLPRRSKRTQLLDRDDDGRGEMGSCPLRTKGRILSGNNRLLTR